MPTTLKKPGKAKGGTLLLEALERWAVAEPRSVRTVQNYRWALARLARGYGVAKGCGLATLEDVTVPNIAAFVEARMKTGTVVSVHHEIAAICTVLRFLASRGECSRELVLQVRALKPRVKRPRAFHARFLTRDEFERLRAAARTQRRCADAAEMTVVLPTLSGLRLGEFSRLRWDDIDLERRVIRVRIDHELGARGTIKTGVERLVPIVEELRAFLAPRRPASGRGFVFPTGPRGNVNRGQPLHARIIWLRLTRARRIAGIPDVTFLTMRHTRASWWIQAGVPIAKAANWLGHGPEICARFYAGLVQGFDPAADLLPREHGGAL